MDHQRRVHVVSLVGRALIGALVAIAAVASIASPPPDAERDVILTVGPHGIFPTIQAAVGAVTNGLVHQIRIEVGTYHETVEIDTLSCPLTSGGLHLSGGWNASFSSFADDPDLTVIDAQDAGRALYIGTTATGIIEYSVSNLTVTGGQALTGGGLWFSAGGSQRLEIADCVIDGNAAVGSSGTPIGGGLFARLWGTGNSLWVHDTRIAHNEATFTGASGGTVRGGGASIEVVGPNPANIERVDFVVNTARAETEISGAGLQIRADSLAIAKVQDCRFVGNEARSTGTPVSSTAGLRVDVLGTGWSRVRRNTLYFNTGQAGNAWQARLAAYDSASLEVGDMVVAAGDSGALILVDEDADLDVTNLTVADNGSIGVLFRADDATSVGSLSNSILYGHTDDLVLQGLGTVDASHNLVGVDPGFVNPAGVNYRLATGSPAEDAGMDHPPADLGPADCDRGLRVIGGAVDIGAYEGIGVLFSDGFNVGDALHWSAMVGG